MKTEIYKILEKKILTQNPVCLTKKEMKAFKKLSKRKNKLLEKVIKEKL